MPRPRKTFVKVGTRYGRLVVTGPIVGRDVAVRCDCGIEKSTNLYSVLRGETVSCGCHRAEQASKRRFKHGLSHTPEFSIWNTMRERCNNLKHISYPRYGALGVTVAPEWGDFARFIADMGPRPSTRHTIDRKDNSNGYGPGNCRWATYTAQARNMSNNLMVDFRGEQICLAELAERTSTPYPRLFYRVTHGWPIEKAISVRPWGGK